MRTRRNGETGATERVGLVRRLGTAGAGSPAQWLGVPGGVQDEVANERTAVAHVPDGRAAVALGHYRDLAEGSRDWVGPHLADPEPVDPDLRRVYAGRSAGAPLAARDKLAARVMAEWIAAGHTVDPAITRKLNIESSSNAS